MCRAFEWNLPEIVVVSWRNCVHVSWISFHVKRSQGTSRGLFWKLESVLSSPHYNTLPTHSHALSGMSLQCFRGESGSFSLRLSQAHYVEWCSKCWPLCLWHCCFETSRLMLCEMSRRETPRWSHRSFFPFKVLRICSLFPSPSSQLFVFFYQSPASL